MNDKDIKQTIEFWESWLNQKKTTNIGEFMIYGGRSLDVCKKYLQEKAERENPQPLTLEKLEEWIGKPVWCEMDRNDYRCGVVGEKLIGDCEKRMVIGFSYGWEWAEDVDCRGKIYDHEPKEVETR